MTMTRREQMEAAAWRYHERHPEVWELFHRFTMEKVNRGFKKYGAKSIMERIRWETAQPEEVGENEFKIGNNITAFYSRWWMKANPQHEGFFRKRQQTSEIKRANTLSELGPMDYSYL